MNFISNIPPLVLALIGLLVGALTMRLLTGKDKPLIQQLSTDLAVAEEKLKQFQNREAEFKQLQQLFIEAKLIMPNCKPAWMSKRKILRKIKVTVGCGSAFEYPV